MAKAKLRNEVVNRLKAAKRTAAELASELGQPEEKIRPVILSLQSEGLVGQQADFFYVIEETASKEELSELEWRVIRFLRTRSDQKAQIADVAKELGMNDASSAINKLVAAGIVVQDGQYYRITAQSALRIPLSADEREQLLKAEQRIEELVGNIYGTQLEVARLLRQIRDNQLYRDRFSRFEDYVAARFERTRDWAYKRIAELEVAEGLVAGQKDQNVEALLQTVTAREIPHLAKLKKEPAKMQQALQEADKQAKSENRERTPEDVKKAVETLKVPPKPKQKEAEPEKKVFTIRFTKLDLDDEETDNLPRYFADFSKWLKGHDIQSAFTIRVAPKAK